MTYLGIDVGGTNTDAVLMDRMEVVGWCKTPTTRDVGCCTATTSTIWPPA